MSKPADLIAIYQCLCDRTRLRILNLLREGPLCVCHVQDVLGEPQVKVSKHLAYLKAHGVVTVRREGYWRIYALAPKPHRALEMNLACLQDAAGRTGFSSGIRKSLRPCADVCQGMRRPAARSRSRSSSR